jgi:hypothetical protein
MASFEKSCKMKFFCIIFFLSITQLYSQKIENKIGDFKITISTYRFEDSKKKSKIGKEEIYFDSLGKTLEKIKYGKHHYNKLNVIGSIEQFQYENEKLIFSNKYTSTCNSCQFYEFYTKYNYNKKNELINEVIFRKENDSVFLSFEYNRKDKSTEIHSGQSTYIQRVYDDYSKLIELNQVYEDSNKIRWQYLYKYGENWKEASFQTYYGDGKDYSKKEIQKYNNQGSVIETEEFYVSISGLDKKTKIYYYENGLIKRIEHYQSYSLQDGYKIISYSDIKIKSKIKVNSCIAKRINEQINIE